MQINFKTQVLPHLVAVLGFLLISMLYFSPALNNQKLETHDWKVYQAAAKEYKEYKQETGEPILWTNSMFSGMPTYLIHSPKQENVFAKIDRFLNFGNWRPIAHLFYYLLGFYLLMLVFRVKPWLSMGGAVAFGFSSYLFIIIAAGHVTKAIALGYMAPVIAGIYLAYDRKPFWGMMLMTFFLILQILTNHVQIVYYTLLTALIYGIYQLVEVIRKKQLIQFGKTTAMLVGGVIIAVAASATPLLTTYEYGDYSIRGPSELSSNKENRTTGLDKDYITQWSYGIDETLTLLVPNFKGGASGGDPDMNIETYQVLRKYVQTEGANQYIRYVSSYFGDQPMTSGPVYVGAFVFFLFIFGLFLVRGKLKWWLLTATILSILLSWGKNFMPFTDFFLEYFPGYNKFRTVSMTLVIAELAIPLLGFLALRDLFNKKIEKARMLKALKIAGISVSAVLLIIIVAPGISNPETDQDGMLVEQIFAGTEGNPQYEQMKVQMMNEYVPALQADRLSLVRKDAFRSLIFVLLGALIVYLVIQRKIKPELAYALIFFVVIVDMWPVNRRYLDTDNFTSKRKFEKPFVASKADNEILKDKDTHYRVANMSVSIFNDASTSWFHHSIGGYHGAKMRRYQELFDSVAYQELSMVRGYANMMLQETQNMQEISAMINASVQAPALSMLNAKYIIIHPQLGPVENANACGNAWFVDDCRMVENADEEVVAVRNIDPHKEAVIDKRFASQLDGFSGAKDDSADIKYIELVSYHPDHMVYESNSSNPQLAVFSEIYYPEGWYAYVDGEKHEHFRANYVLRAMRVPAGKHEIEFRFEPQSYKTGNTIQYAAAGVFFLLLLGGIFVERKRCKLES
jgi:hypothetical protein